MLLIVHIQKISFFQSLVPSTFSNGTADLICFIDCEGCVGDGIVVAAAAAVVVVVTAAVVVVVASPSKQLSQNCQIDQDIQNSSGRGCCCCCCR